MIGYDWEYGAILSRFYDGLPGKFVKIQSLDSNIAEHPEKDCVVSWDVDRCYNVNSIISTLIP